MKLKRTLCLIVATVFCLGLLLPAARALTADEARDILERYYIEALPQTVYDEETVEGVLAALGDRYTQHFTPQEYQDFLSLMRDTVTVGIGVVGAQDPLGLWIIQVLEDSSAQAAGLQPGDILTAVDGKAAAGLSLELVSTWIRGEEGTDVTVTVLRDGQLADYVLTRTKVVLSATATQLVDGHIAYIQCSTFGEETLGHFEEGIEAYDGPADRWIVDLRNNGGGELNAAVQSVGTFTGSGCLAYLRNAAGQYAAYACQRDMATGDPVLVLTGPSTASAAEIFAGAIRTQGRGLVIGERTFGKGVAQVILDENSSEPYFSRGDALKVTAYRFFGGTGLGTQGIGVIPDLLLSGENTEKAALLLCGGDPGRDNAGALRLELGWQWDLDPVLVSSPDCRGALTELLEALPPCAVLWLGTGDGQWAELTPAQAAGQLGLTEYTPRAFSDTARSEYAHAIDALAACGLLTPDGQGAFRPGEELTRGELCVLLQRALRCSAGEGAPFSDVEADAWYAQAVNALYAAGIVNGVGGGRFEPDAPVDCQQLITALARVGQRLSMCFYDLEPEPEVRDAWSETLAGFEPWARPGVWLLSESQSDFFGNTVELLWAEPQDLQPDAPATRAEAAALLYSVLAWVGAIPM